MKVEPKKFFVSGPDGQVEAEQLATFAYYIGGEQFRFVVTRLPGQHAVITHRASGKKVTDVPYMTQFKCSDYAEAGKVVLKHFLERVGEARVASVLRTAELSAPSTDGVTK